jgi:hypothetical protein
MSRSLGIISINAGNDDGLRKEAEEYSAIMVEILCVIRSVSIFARRKK